MSVFVHSCADKSVDPVVCPAGSFAPSGSLVCQPCPLGSHCPSNTSAVHTPCAPGSYANETSLLQCRPCPAGFLCQTPALSPVACENGTYSKGSAANCTVCPPGFRYAEYIEYPLQLYAFYNVGFFCWSFDMLRKLLLRVQGNLFLFPARCPNKDSDPIPCNASTYGPGASTECRQCPAGSECPSAKLSTHVPCRNGTYADSEGNSACLQCPAGFTCPNPAASPVPCENGTYSFKGAALCSVCPAGYRYYVT